MTWRQKVTAEDLKAGVARILWGLFKKLVVADTVSMQVDAVYADPSSQSGPALVVATILFGIQIYCDFSAYSDIAIGSARLFGVNLMENFRSPYLSTSISEFWRRWHISLSTWLRDYVYVPLGGNRTARSRWYFNIMVTFFLSGLWHGANWTFVVWGALHGLAIVIERMIGWPATASGAHGLGGKILVGVRWLTTLTLVMCAWAFFRADSLGDAMTVFGGMGSGWSHLSTASIMAGVPADRVGIGFAMFLAVFAIEALWCERADIGSRIAGVNLVVRWSAMLMLLFGVIMLGTFGSEAFIYFQF
ncbi:hypothetical protein GCM10011505_43090 [Tistrella bauzanensis]|uniref:Probable alginate O-acetylase AlgI n=1 Tax=Tistrella bauzanensis TaxID=657419 RepID=A0ABQ1J180_9PROT|nr:MBOAT family O-acyltransferase [Tistrella bauzanensis]GGB57577.1 hypothetical protein GCM10011505_43090 [Tistrella bauzanensis]